MRGSMSGAVLWEGLRMVDEQEKKTSAAIWFASLALGAYAAYEAATIRPTWSKAGDYAQGAAILALVLCVAAPYLETTKGGRGVVALAGAAGLVVFAVMFSR